MTKTDDEAPLDAPSAREGNSGGSRIKKVAIRVVSGAVYAIVILVCLYLDPIAIAVVVSVMALLCCFEYFRMMRMTGRMPNELLGLVAAGAFPLAALLPGMIPLFLTLSLLVFAAAAWYVLIPRVTISDVALTVFGPVYTSLMFSTVVLIRRSSVGDVGALLAFGIMGSVWVNDAAAYFVGSRFGKHKLAPSISPNKTIEGFWGGLAGSVIVWLILAILKVHGIDFLIATLSGVIVGFMGVVGDLFESRIKRGVGVKDSGKIIPGHGGMLDRSDSLLFACTVAYIMLYITGKL